MSCPMLVPIRPFFFFFFSSRRRHTRSDRDWSSDVCSSDLGLLAFTINLQGGSPEGYSKEQPWNNSAFRPNGSLRPEYMQRLERILNKADELGMVVILGIFYFGQDERLENAGSIVGGTDAATD